MDSETIPTGDPPDDFGYSRATGWPYSPFNHRQLAELASETPIPAGGDAFDTQEGGAHYRSMPVQVTEFIHKNRIGWCEGNAIKYLVRHKQKGGVESLRKAIHYIEMLITMEYPNDEKLQKP